MKQFCAAIVTVNVGRFGEVEEKISETINFFLDIARISERDVTCDVILRSTEHTPTTYSY